VDGRVEAVERSAIVGLFRGSRALRKLLLHNGGHFP